MWAVFEPFVNSSFNFPILQSDGNIKYFIGTFQIWGMVLDKTVTPSLKILLIDYPDPQLYFHPYT